jgi:hypothetical protein
MIPLCQFTECCERRIYQTKKYLFETPIFGSSRRGLQVANIETMRNSGIWSGRLHLKRCASMIPLSPDSKSPSRPLKTEKVSVAEDVTRETPAGLFSCTWESGVGAPISDIALRASSQPIRRDATEAQVRFIGQTLRERRSAKLARDFQRRHFSSNSSNVVVTQCSIYTNR